MKNYDELYSLADGARKKAHAPYSNITVGAALLSKSGKIYTGANIENAAFSPSVCAERVAFFEAIHAGERDFLAIAVAGGEKDKEAKGVFSPCGVCRQVMREFCKGGFKIIFGKESEATLAELLPYSFSGEDIK